MSPGVRTVQAAGALEAPRRVESPQQDSTHVMTDTTRDLPELDRDEIRDWLDSLDAVIDCHGLTATGRLLQELTRRGEHAGVQLPFTANTPYVNTIPPEEDPAYPGDRDLEQRLKSLVRWNALAMVVRANREADGIGGHISTYASAATLYEVGFNHFFRATTDTQPADLVYYQGHAAPGVYARAPGSRAVSPPGTSRTSGASCGAGRACRRIRIRG